MTIPRRFVTEYPERCLALLDVVEPIARDKDFVASFALLSAASVLVIPYERLGAHHPMKVERRSALYDALRGLEKKPWGAAPFWDGREPDVWHFSRIMGDPNKVSRWRNLEDLPSMSPDANDIRRRKAGEVLRVLRNALAHGNIVYLNKHGHESPDTQVEYLGFLSRYEETEEQRAEAETYRLVAVTDEGFLSFLRLWATWLAGFPHDDRLTEAA